MKNNPDKVDGSNGKKCPHITDPYLDCYGIGFDSANAQKAIKYCLGDYMDCEIYIRHRDSQVMDRYTYNRESINS